jgi:hypothetical protein
LWTWDGAQGTLLEAETTMPRRSGFNIVAFDEARGVYVLFGGVNRPGGEVVNETWERGGMGVPDGVRVKGLNFSLGKRSGRLR